MYVYRNSLYCISTWSLFYILMAIHSANFLNLGDYLEKVILYPLSASIIMFIVAYKTDKAVLLASEDEASKTIGKEKYMEILNFLLLLPIGISIIVMVAAQLIGSYEKLVSWINILGVIIGGQAGVLLKNYHNDKK